VFRRITLLGCLGLFAVATEAWGASIIESAPLTAPNPSIALYDKVATFRFKENVSISVPDPDGTPRKILFRAGQKIWIKASDAEQMNSVLFVSPVGQEEPLTAIRAEWLDEFAERYRHVSAVRSPITTTEETGSYTFLPDEIIQEEFVDSANDQIGVSIPGDHSGGVFLVKRDAFLKEGAIRALRPEELTQADELQRPRPEPELSQARGPAPVSEPGSARRNFRNEGPLSVTVLQGDARGGGPKAGERLELPPGFELSESALIKNAKGQAGLWTRLQDDEGKLYEVIVDVDAADLGKLVASGDSAPEEGESSGHSGETIAATTTTGTRKGYLPPSAGDCARLKRFKNPLLSYDGRSMFISESGRRKRLLYRSAIVDAANRHQVEPWILEASLALETQFDPLLENSAEKNEELARAAKALGLTKGKSTKQLREIYRRPEVLAKAKRAVMGPPQKNHWGRGLCQFGPALAKELGLDWASEPSAGESLSTFSKRVPNSVFNPAQCILRMAEKMRASMDREYLISTPSGSKRVNVGPVLYPPEADDRLSQATRARSALSMYNRGNMVVASLEAFHSNSGGKFPESYGQIWHAKVPTSKTQKFVYSKYDLLGPRPHRHRPGETVQQETNHIHVMIGAGMCGPLDPENPRSMVEHYMSEYGRDAEGKWVSRL